MNIQAKADFTYRIYKDLLEWINRHKECRDWLFFLDSYLGDSFSFFQKGIKRNF